MSTASYSKFRNIRFVFLDREGVLNLKPPEGRYITQWCDFHILPGVEEAIRHLNYLDCKVIVVTNQRCVALGLCTEADVLRLHNQLLAHLAVRGARIDSIYYCPHEINSCHCRKPLTGMFEKAFGDFPNAHAANSVMVGDSLSDIEAGIAMGMRTVLLRGVEGPDSPAMERATLLADVCCASLLDWVTRNSAVSGAL